MGQLSLGVGVPWKEGPADLEPHQTPLRGPSLCLLRSPTSEMLGTAARGCGAGVPWVGVGRGYFSSLRALGGEGLLLPGDFKTKG